MQITIILTGLGGELDRQTIRTSDEAMSHDIIEALSAWPLMPGDTIKIVDGE